MTLGELVSMLGRAPTVWPILERMGPGPARCCSRTLTAAASARPLVLVVVDDDEAERLGRRRADRLALLGRPRRIRSASSSGSRIWLACARERLELAIERGA